MPCYYQPRTFRALPRSKALSPLPANPILCGRIIPRETPIPPGTASLLWAGPEIYSSKCLAIVFSEVDLLTTPLLGLLLSVPAAGLL